MFALREPTAVRCDLALSSIDALGQAVALYIECMLGGFFPLEGTKFLETPPPVLCAPVVCFLRIFSGDALFHTLRWHGC